MMLFLSACINTMENDAGDAGFGPGFKKFAFQQIILMWSLN
jgi:hypothetical protein